MNDIEKQIEGVTEEAPLEDKEINKEEDSISHKSYNSGNNKNKKITIYIVIGVLLLIVVSLLAYIIIGNDDKDNNIDNNDKEVIDNSTKEDEEEKTNSLGYVSCDDNTGLLNVRNSVGGTIIDGLSCYKEVTIEEELEKTEVCDKWYKISYTKKGSDYTGYACGTYIKKQEVAKEVIISAKSLIDKANDYYENNVLKAYCGTSSNESTKTIDFGNNMTGTYIKSEYKSIDELKKYLLTFLDEDLLTIKLELSDINNPKYYDNYYEIDGNLYCRAYAGKGWMTTYTGNYNIEVISHNDSKTVLNIAYEYIGENAGCTLEELSSCGRNDFTYEIGKVTIENNIITKIDFHN